MPRSSRHKSSKHSSRDAREHSDSEKESSLRERKSKGESSIRVSKESGSGDKRKLDSKEYYDSFNGEYGEYTSSKRRKEKTEDSVNDRWNGGDGDRGESLKKSKTSSEKSRRREEVEGEETRKNSSKSDGKHRESSRRESKEIGKEKDRDRDRDRDRKHKEGKSEKLYDGEDHYGSKVVSDKTDLNAQDQLQSPGSENYSQKRARRKKDDYGDGDKHQDSVNDVSERRGENIKDGYVKDGRQKEENPGDVEVEKQRGEKQKDDRPSKEHSRSDDKLFRDEKEASESKRRKSKFQENDHDLGHEPDSEHDGYRDRSRDYERSRDYDRGRDRDREQDRDWDHERDRDHDRNRDRDRERDHDPDHGLRDYEHDRDRDRSRDRDRGHDRERTRDREKDRSRDYYHDRERSKGECDRDFDRDSRRQKDSRERRKSPDDHDHLSDSKSRTVVAHVEMESRNNREQLDNDRIKSQSRHPSGSHGDQDDIGHMSDLRSKGISSRDTADLSGGSERGSTYRASEKSGKVEDGSFGELSVERSSSSKASPQGLIEKSPSSTSLERRYINRIGTRRSLEVEETGQRSNTRELLAHEERLSRDLAAEKSFGDDSSQVGLPFSNKAHQNNSSFPPRPESRGGIGSPMVGSLEEDNRVNVGGRYKRGGDLNMGRGQGNAWRGAPNWPSPVPNGFIPFPHGPPHGGFQSLMPGFPSPSLFGVRPSMEMNHSGIPYHMPDAERFSGHLRPLGWQHMVEGSVPSHMHGWDMSNGVFRDEPHMFGGAEWDHSRRARSRGWESSVDSWKAQNGGMSMDVSSVSQKDDEQSRQAVDENALTGQTSHSENNRAKSVEAVSNLTSPAKDLAMDSPKIQIEDTSGRPVSKTEVNAESYGRYYLSKLDISVKLVDAELQNEYVGLLMDEQCPITDEGTAVVINLKDEGKTLLKGDYATLSRFSVIPTARSSLFQVAMDMYKEQRVEVKGLPNMEKENEGCPVANPDGGDEAKEEEDCCIRGASDVEISQERLEEAASSSEAEADGGDDDVKSRGDDVTDEEEVVRRGEELVVAETGESVVISRRIRQSTH